MSSSKFYKLLFASLLTCTAFTSGLFWNELRNCAVAWIHHPTFDLVGFGTLCLAFVTVYGDEIKRWIWHPKLSFELHKAGSWDLTTANIKQSRNTDLLMNIKMAILHMAVRNTHPKTAGKDCHVKLISVRAFHEGSWQKSGISIPFNFSWAPQEQNPSLTKNVQEYEVFDFANIVSIHEDKTTGVYTEGNVLERAFGPILQSFPSNFRGRITTGTKAVYHIRLEASNHQSVDSYIEVDWSGMTDYPTVNLLKKSPVISNND